MSVFDAYDQEYRSLVQEISKNLSELKTYTSGDDRASASVRQVDGLLKQASELIKQMEVEMRGQDAATRKALSEKVGEYKKSLLAYQSDFERAREQTQRSELIGDKSATQRSKLLDVNDKLNRQNQVIQNAIRTVAETEEVGMEITSELARNREKIQSAHTKVHEFSGITDSARRVLTSMARRDVQQRFILAFIAVVLIIAIVITAYFASGKSTSSSSR